MEDVRTDDLEALAESLENTVPPAPEMPPRSMSEPQRSSRDAGEIKRLKSQEELLLRADRLLISDGARLVLFLPLVVIALYGLAQTFITSNPQWWANHIEAAVGGLGMSTGIYGLSLLMLVADTALLLILLRLMVLTRTIFRLEEGIDYNWFDFQQCSWLCRDEGHHRRCNQATGSHHNTDGLGCHSTSSELMASRGSRCYSDTGGIFDRGSAFGARCAHGFRPSTLQYK